MKKMLYCLLACLLAVVAFIFVTFPVYAEEAILPEAIPQIAIEKAQVLGYRYVVFAYQIENNGGVIENITVKVIDNPLQVRYSYAMQPQLNPNPNPAYDDYMDIIFQEEQDWLNNEEWIEQELDQLRQSLKEMGYDMFISWSGVFADHVCYFKKVGDTIYKLILTHELKFDPVFPNNGSTGLPYLENFIRQTNPFYFPFMVKMP